MYVITLGGGQMGPDTWKLLEIIPCTAWVEEFGRFLFHHLASPLGQEIGMAILAKCCFLCDELLLGPHKQYLSCIRHLIWGEKDPWEPLKEAQNWFIFEVGKIMAVQCLRMGGSKFLRMGGSKFIINIAGWEVPSFSHET